MADHRAPDAAQRIVCGETVRCLGCGVAFVRHHARRVYCTPSCRWRASRARRAAAGLPTRGCAECRSRAAEIARLRERMAGGGRS